jgi:hypothetical protein
VRIITLNREGKKATVMYDIDQIFPCIDKEKPLKPKIEYRFPYRDPNRIFPEEVTLTI